MFGVLGGLLAAYLMWLFVRGPRALQLGVTNGWVGTAFRLAAGVVCLIFGLRQRRGSYVPLVFGVALIFTAIGNTILTLDSLHGPPPPPPSPADIFGLGFLALCFTGIGLMAYEDRQRLSPRELLDGGIAALGAAAVCAAFILAHIPRPPGQSTVGSAFLLAYSIGDVVLVLLVVGAATVVAGQSRAPWVALTAAFALLAVGSALGAALGMTVAVRILTTIQWPAATLLIAAAMWAEPGAPDPLAVPRGVALWTPALACGAAIAVLFAATLTRVDHAATALAAGTLLLVMARGYSELRHEIGTRERTEKSLRVSEAGYRRIADEQAALRRVATLVAAGGSPSTVFAAVAEEVGRLLAVEGAFVVRYEADDTVTTVAASNAADKALPVGLRRPVVRTSLSWLVRECGGPARIDYEADPVALEYGISSSVAAPITVEGHLWGYIAASWTGDRPPSDTEARLAAFTELVATAIANAESRAQLMASRARIVAAADQTRRRIERDLHDGAQQRLVSLALQLRAAQAGMPPGPAAQLDTFSVGLNGALDDLRELARGIHPPVLAKGGLGPALNALARRSAVPVEVALRTAGRLPERVEIAAYYVVSEALTNATKHAHATAIRVTVEADDDDHVLRIAICDDGVGGADFTRGTGLVGLRDRVEALSGRILLDSPPGAGTRLRAELPIPATNDSVSSG